MLQLITLILIQLFIEVQQSFMIINLRLLGFDHNTYI